MSYAMVNHSQIVLVSCSQYANLLLSSKLFEPVSQMLLPRSSSCEGAKFLPSKDKLGTGLERGKPCRASPRHEGIGLPRRVEGRVIS
jgi:hypothetical protein